MNKGSSYGRGDKRAASSGNFKNGGKRRNDGFRPERKDAGSKGGKFAGGEREHKPKRFYSDKNRDGGPEQPGGGRKVNRSKPADNRPFREREHPSQKRDGRPEQTGGERKINRSRPADNRPFREREHPFQKRDDRPEQSRGEKKVNRSRPSDSRPFREQEHPFQKRDDKQEPSRGEKKVNRSRPADSRPFREREQPFGKKKPFEKKREVLESKPEVPEVKTPTFSDVVKNAFNEASRKKVADDHPAKREQFEDKVYGELADIKNEVKRPYERKENKATGKKGVKDEGRHKKFKESDDDDVNDGDEKDMPLNKYIAHSGECSRRDAAELVKQGKVKVNGELVMDPGYRVKQDDNVTLSGKKLRPQKGLVYLLLNKPKGYITTNDDPQGRRTVMELVSNSGADRLYPVGRLDRDTSGLLLITNDGDLTQKLSHPSYNIKKVYHVTLDKPLTKADFEKVIEGVDLEDGKAEVDELAYLEAKNEVGLEIHSGRNRIVRRIFESLGYVVDKLDRVMYAGLTKKNLPRGKWRKLTDHEVVLLKHFKN